MQGAYEVFVSYSWPNRDIVARLVRELERRGLRSWFDGHAAPAGEDLERAMRKALDAARACIVVLSPATDPAQPFVSKEWSAILEASWRRSDLRLCPLRIGGVEPPPFLRAWQSVVVPGTPPDLGQAAEQIATLLAQPNAGPSDEAIRRERSIAAARIADIQRMVLDLRMEGGSAPRHEQGG